jgi:hypothetical protein
VTGATMVGPVTDGSLVGEPDVARGTPFAA